MGAPLEAATTWPGAAELLRTCVLLFGLGLAMGFSPTTVGIQIDVLTTKAGAARRVVIIIAAIAAAATLLTVLFTAVSPNTLHALWTGDVRTVIAQRWLDVAVGLALVIFGGLRWRRARRPATIKPAGRLDRPRVLATAVFANSMISTTGPATMYLVVRTLGTTAPIAWPVEYLVFLAGLAAPYVVLAVILLRVPGVEQRLSGWLARLSHLDLRRPIAAVIIAAGLALAVWAVVHVTA